METTITQMQTDEEKETAALLACYRLLLRKAAERKARLAKEVETAVSTHSTTKKPKKN